MDRALIGRFVSEGFVKIAHAFPRDTAAAARAILWRDTGCDPEDPATWTKPPSRAARKSGIRPSP